jgi:hypothetical protein
MTAFFDSPDGQTPQGVMLLDPATGLPVNPTSPDVAMGSGAVTPKTVRVTMATDGPGVAALASIDTKTAALRNGAVPTEPLGRLGVAHQITAAAAASATLALSAGVTRLRISARNANCRIAIGTGAQTATNSSGASTSHFLQADTSMDVACLAGSQISVIRGSDQTVDGIVHVSELI